MQLQFSIDAPQQQFISVTAIIETPNQLTELGFSKWRPGRYQFGYFAKNIKSFAVFDENGKKIDAKKTTSSAWEIDTSNCNKISVNYKYYAAELNAGSTYLDNTQLYVNPVNCCIYDLNKPEQTVSLTLEFPEDWEYAGPLPIKQKTITAKSFHELADSPFIISNDLQYANYEVGDTTFHIWFNGLVDPKWKQLISDFKSFTEKQIEKFIEFPTKDYHFLFQILPYKAYHGVEHEKCTVITLGPSYAVFEELYKELLGVSSHELYHTWNVKAIKPLEMLPYDYQKENFTELGYLTEGVTTYMGDLMLYKSGVFNIKQYFRELENQLQKHFDNFGRFNHSVADSSWDTWLDGYEPGVPGRKVSIYTEGCLLAFITDVMLLKATDNQRNLDVVMRDLFYNYAKKNQGITREIYKKSIENAAGNTDFEWLLEQYYYGTKAYESILMDCFEYLGIELEQVASDDWCAAYLGAKSTINEKGNYQVTAIYPGSSIDLAGGMIKDEILAINDIYLSNDLNRWGQFFHHKNQTLTIKRGGQIMQLVIPQLDKIFYKKYILSLVDQPDKNQKSAFNAWSR